MGRGGYPPEFRCRVLDLSKAGRKVADVARALGISEQAIYNWRRQDRIDRGLEPGLSSGEHAELVSDQDFRALLVALNFEASYEPTRRKLTDHQGNVGSRADVSWWGQRAPLLSVHPALHNTNLLHAVNGMTFGL